MHNKALEGHSKKQITAYYYVLPGGTTGDHLLTGMSSVVCKVTGPMTTSIKIPPYSKCGTIL